ncbi:MAG: alpha/beta fold hydrolase [Candidatus Puniceispirillales bacterium]|jgi:pimeloyl-ACP methyl ester carboxylesterase|tara:strand:- start:1354 stop:2271 length:918 start_codon:yes stop_codon:yes gene_type:complete
MISADETFKGTWPFAPKYFNGNGFQQHYVDEGSKTAETIICLHGEPTWGYIYRNFIPQLSDKYRIVVPDMMGFGKSETPQNKEYTLKTHVENLDNLIKYLDLKNITFVGQDWGGPITGAYAIRNLDRVKGFILINTLFGYSKEERPKTLTPWFKWIKKHYEAGTLNGILGELSSTLLSVMKIPNFTNNKIIDDNWLNAYSSQFPDRASCLGAINFPLDALLNRIVPFIVEGFKEGDIKGLCSKPAILAYGMQDKAIDPDYAIRDFKALFPESKVTKIQNAGHYSQEDEPQILIDLIKKFMKDNEI